VDVHLPKRIEALDGIHVAAVAAGEEHAIALTRCGHVCSWGVHGSDTLGSGLESSSDNEGDGDGTYTDDLFKPQLITALLGERVQAIAASSERSCAVTDAGVLYTWGLNIYGNLGHGDVLGRERPTLVTALNGIRVVGVSMSFKHTLALAADGSVHLSGKGPGLGLSPGNAGEEEVGPWLTPQRIPNLKCMVSR
jgi:alpha-tubulin suppressor-like RCC1 family protein